MNNPQMFLMGNNGSWSSGIATKKVSQIVGWFQKGQVAAGKYSLHFEATDLVDVDDTAMAFTGCWSFACGPDQPAAQTTGLNGFFDAVGRLTPGLKQHSRGATVISMHQAITPMGITRFFKPGQHLGKQYWRDPDQYAFTITDTTIGTPAAVSGLVYLGMHRKDGVTFTASITYGRVWISSKCWLKVWERVYFPNE